jgi:hypothetical protein
VLAHKAVCVFGFRFDIGRRGERFGVLQQADGRFLLGLPAAEAGGVLVMSVGGKPSEVREILSCPVAVYWMETTENRKSESILIFIVSIIYTTYYFQKRE